MSSAAWISLFNLLAVVVGFIYQAYVASRNRKWAKEDREAIAQESLGAIKEASGHAQAAYREANTVNEKLAKMSLGNKAQIDRMEEVGKDSQRMLGNKEREG